MEYAKVSITPLAVAILSVLNEAAAHPYELQQLFHDRHLDRFVKIRAGSLYHTVERLHRLGLIEPVQTSRSGRRPERTVYAITDDGRDEFLSSLKAMLRHPTVEYPVFGSAVEMLRVLDPDEAATLLEFRIVELESSLAALDQVAVGLVKRGLPRIKLIELEYAQAIQRAELAWVSTLAEEIRAGVIAWPANATPPPATLLPATPLPATSASTPGPALVPLPQEGPQHERP